MIERVKLVCTVYCPFFNEGKYSAHITLTCLHYVCFSLTRIVKETCILGRGSLLVCISSFFLFDSSLKLLFLCPGGSGDEQVSEDTRLLTGEELVELMLSVSPVKDGGLTTVGMVGAFLVIVAKNQNMYILV